MIDDRPLLISPVGPCARSLRMSHSRFLHGRGVCHACRACLHLPRLPSLPRLPTLPTLAYTLPRTTGVEAFRAVGCRMAVRRLRAWGAQHRQLLQCVPSPTRLLARARGLRAGCACYSMRCDALARTSQKKSLRSAPAVPFAMCCLCCLGVVSRSQKVGSSARLRRQRRRTAGEVRVGRAACRASRRSCLPWVAGADIAAAGAFQC